MRSLSLLLACIFAGSGVAQDLLLQNAQIVDPAAQKITRGNLLIRNGVIEQIIPAVPEEFSGEKIDLTGKYIIPGLNDMHVHSFGNVAPANNVQLLTTPGTAKMMLYAGVTGFLDLFSLEKQIFSDRAKQQQISLSGADIYCAGPILTCTGGHGTEYGIATRVINTPAEAEKEIADLAQHKPDVVKIVYDHAAAQYFPTIDHATMEAAIKAATKHHLKTVIHIGTWQDAKEAVLAGASAITHLYREEIPDELVALMKQKNVHAIPTLCVTSELSNFARLPSLLDNSLLAAVTTPAMLQAFRDTAAFDPRTKAWLHRQIGRKAIFHRSLKKLADGGVKIMTGTDGGNLGTFHGFSLHREMQLMAEAGMKPWQVLAAATTTPGEFFGRPFGVQPGSVANLLVLNASPLENIENTQQLAMVIHHGKRINREHLLKPPVLPWTQTLLDDFSQAELMSSCGRKWEVDLDSEWGGKSTMQNEYRDGMLQVQGHMQPANGRPGMAGLSLAFGEQNTAFDVTQFSGIRLRIKATNGTLFLKMLTAGISNYDYHALVISNSAEFQELELPFAQFKQFWSAPSAWTGTDVTGIALWVSGFQPEGFEFVIDKIELY